MAAAARFLFFWLARPGQSSFSPPAETPGDPGASGGSAMQMQWPDGSVMQWPDGSAMEWPDA